MLFTLICHRKKEKNILIPPDLWSLPTTQKAVMNAIVSRGMQKDPNGFREIYVYNCYSVSGLFFLFKTQYKI